MTNAWFDFLGKYSKEKGITWNEAIKQGGPEYRAKQKKSGNAPPNVRRKTRKMKGGGDSDAPPETLTSESDVGGFTPESGVDAHADLVGGKRRRTRGAKKRGTKKRGTKKRGSTKSRGKRCGGGATKRKRPKSKSRR